MSIDLSMGLEPLLTHINGKRLALFLDYDGTLVPVSNDPADAVLPESTHRLLKALASRYNVTIISGRSLKDLKERVGIEGITYVGNHGMEVSSGSFTMKYDIGQIADAELQSVACKLSALTLRWPGTVLEVKEVSLSLHYKTLSGDALEFFEREAGVLIDQFVSSGVLRVTGGKKIIEIRSSVMWHKGSAVAWIMQRRGFRGSFPLYIGDDLTDIDAFRVIRGVGVSVFVGGYEEESDYFFDSTAVVLEFLSSIAV